MKRTGAIIAGLLIAAVGQFLALGLAGAGHGWNTPFLVSVILWFAYPKVLVRALGSPKPRSDELATLLAAFVGDAILVLMTLEEGFEYFPKIVQIEGILDASLWIGGWIAIWLGWQLIAFLNLRQANGRRTA